MEMHVREADGVSVINFSGNLDTNTSISAEEEVNKLLDSGGDRILFNFANLNYISSAGLRVLLATAKKLKTSGGKMMVCSLNSTVQEVFDISGFASILNLASNEEEALAAL